MTGVRIGIDTGGTFTDVVAVDEDGHVRSTKVPSSPSDPATAFMRAIEKTGAEVIRDVAHGTTVATNALLEDDFGGLGLITTKGFRAVLEIGRQSVPDSYGNSYFWVKPERIVPLHLVREVEERIDHAGNPVTEFDEAGAREVARWFREQGVACVGVCFVHAYMNPDHERRMRDVLAAEHPDCAVSLSSDVLNEYREFERAVTTLVDAFVKPRVAAYARSIHDRLGSVPFYIMKSNGGVIAGREVHRQPITTILSGPAAGTLGAALVARRAGFERVITLDGGGTSTDVAVISGGEPTLTTEGAVGRFAVKVPMVDVVTVGTGGGSIAWASPERTLKVGPRSAGASPGPACYGQGGTEPTATDAFLLLGHIPEHLLGGEIPLDRAAARAAYERLAGSVGLEVEPCAAGVLEISAWNQANAIRQVTVKRGLDVRDFDLCAFGGSGPLGACRLIDILSLRAVFVPRDPGNLSAFGLLATDLRTDHVQTLVRRHDQLDADELDGGVRPARGRGPRGARPPGARAGRADAAAQRRPALLRPGVRDPRPRRRLRRAGRGRLPRRPRALVRLLLPRRPAPGRRVGQPARDRRGRDQPPGTAARRGRRRRSGPGARRQPAAVRRRRVARGARLPARPPARRRRRQRRRR